MMALVIYMLLSKDVVIASCSNLISIADSVFLASDFEFHVVANKLKNDFKAFDPFKQWKDNELNPKSFNDFTIDWIFLCDLLNFSFWKDESGTSFDVEFNGKVYKNYWSLPATLNKFSQKLVDPKFYSNISLEEFDQIFNPNIPLKLERIRLMNDAGKVLVEKYDGLFSNYLKKVGYLNSWNFINSLIKDFPSFYDFNEEYSCFFLKRAQILVADLWAASEGKLFNGTIEELTIFADYRYRKRLVYHFQFFRIPQVLNSLDLIKYRPHLKLKLYKKEILPSGSKEEAEIRAISIIACEKLKKLLSCNNAVELDFYLWVLFVF